MPVEKICEHCGTQFFVRPAKGKQRFCSVTCQKEARETAHADLTCKNCGQTFHVTRKREADRQFCGKECTVQYQAVHGRPAALLPKTEFFCKQCGNTFGYKPGAGVEYRRRFGKDPQYCSVSCAALGRRAASDVKHQAVCKNCGKTFFRTRRNGTGTIYQEQQLCSRACKSEWVSKVYREKHGLPSVTERVKRGYVVLRFPAKDGVPAYETLKHRHVMAEFLGRPLTAEETVHHRNGDRRDNSSENLELRAGNHGPGQSLEDIVDWVVQIAERYPSFFAKAGVAVRRLEPPGS